MNYPINTIDQLRPILVGFRKSRQLTQAALADKLGITQQTYAQLEANPSSASMERVFKLLRVLGVQLVMADDTPATNPLRTVMIAKDVQQPVSVVAEMPADYAAKVTPHSTRTPKKNSLAPQPVHPKGPKKESW